MSTPTGISHPKQRIFSADVEGFDSLSELALDLRSSWNHATDDVWRQLDPVLWEFTHNPWVVLQTVSRKKLQRVLAEPVLRKKVDDLVREYTEKHYLAAASAYQVRGADHGAIGKQIADWQQAVDQKWDSLRFGRVRVESDGQQHRFEVELSLNGIDPKAVRVDLCADATSGADPPRQEMICVAGTSDAAPRRVYHASIAATRPASDYTARVIPQYCGVAVPLECARIPWQR
jgi:starch phosphorylase